MVERRKEGRTALWCGSPGSRTQAAGSLEEGGTLPRMGCKVGGGTLEKIMPEKNPEGPPGLAW